MCNIYDAVFSNSIVHDVSSSVAAVDLGKGDKSITYAQLKSYVDAIRSTACIKADDKVALVMSNSLELVVGLLAIWAQGAATAPLNPSYTSNEFKDLFDDLEVNKVLVLSGDEDAKRVLKEASPDISIMEIDTSRLEPSGTTPPQADQANNVALYLHTSGTTGKPKAVPLRHSNLLRGASNVAETYALNSLDRTYLLQVLFHIHGIVAALLAPLTTGGSIVIPPGGKLDASRAWSDFSEHACSWVTGTPSILQTLLAASCPEPIPNIRFIRSCSSPLLPTVFNALRKRFGCPVIEAYAMTEASHQMCSNRLDLFSSGTVGPESGGARICIWDGGNRGCELGVEGEVSVSGENVMDGYEGVSPEKNTEAFWHGVDERGYEARWFRTGDRGILSSDGHRRLTLIGRLSEMVNRGGEKISPVEVDEAMMLASDDIKEAAAFSVHDDFYGQEIEAAVVRRDGSRLTEAELQQLLEQRLAKFKIPKRIHFCEGKIPKGPTGKIQRKNLTQIFAGANESNTEHSDRGRYDIHGIIDKSLRLKAGTSKAAPNATLLELGADSMGLARIVSSTKQNMGKQLSMAELFAFPTVARVAQMVDNITSQGSGEQNGSTKPDAFSLLPLNKEELQTQCHTASVDLDNVEDAFPFSASQKAFHEAFLQDGSDNNLLWMLNRYSTAEGVDKDQLLKALTDLQFHEESLRWTLAQMNETEWITLQIRAGVEQRVQELHVETQEQAQQEIDSRLSACRHSPGAKTLQILLVHIGQELELAFIESHLFTEGQGRALILENLEKLYNGDKPEPYPPYTTFVEKHPASEDEKHKLEFWHSEKAAWLHSEGSDWPRKASSLILPADLASERLELLGVEDSVESPFQQMSAHVGMTLPLAVEAVFALSLALYLEQQDPAFTRGQIVYDRAVSLRTAEDAVQDLRALTQGYHPNAHPLALANSSLWTYLQHFKSMTQLREQNVCINATSTLANHSAAFTWRFLDGLAPPGQLIAGVKAEAMAMRTFKTCYINANRRGPNGVTIAIGFHPKWLDEQRNNGSSVELIDVFCRALRFMSNQHDDLTKLNLDDLRSAAILHTVG